MKKQKNKKTNKQTKKISTTTTTTKRAVSSGCYPSNCISLFKFKVE